MPSNTFFNLPEEKREKLLEAATEEFGRVPYEKASINRMIQAAGIPRGSFYMYFTDKEDLFHHLMQGPREAITVQMEDTLERNGGDLFATTLEFFDQAMETFRSWDQDPIFKKLCAIMMKNPTLGQMYLTQSKSEMLSRLSAKVDRERLDLRQEGDLETMLLILMGTLVPAVMGAMQKHDPEDERKRLKATLDILRRGMEKAPDAKAEKE